MVDLLCLLRMIAWLAGISGISAGPPEHLAMRAAGFPRFPLVRYLLLPLISRLTGAIRFFRANELVNKRATMAPLFSSRLTVTPW